MRGIQESAYVRNLTLQLLKAKPAPMTIFDLGVALAPLAGSTAQLKAEENVKFFKQLHEEVKARVEQGVGALTEEKYRLYWDNYTMWRLLGTMSRILVPQGANIIIGRYPLGFGVAAETYNPEDPVHTLAVNTVIGFWYRFGRGEDVLGQWGDEYSLEGFLFPNSRPCRLMSGFQEDLMDELEKSYGKPCVMFDADMVDPALFSHTQAVNRVQALLETIDGRKATWR
jgi:benzoyl-CoA reductase subunit B